MFNFPLKMYNFQCKGGFYWKIMCQNALGIQFLLYIGEENIFFYLPVLVHICAIVHIAGLFFVHFYSSPLISDWVKNLSFVLWNLSFLAWPWVFFGIRPWVFTGHTLSFSGGWPWVHCRETLMSFLHVFAIFYVIQWVLYYISIVVLFYMDAWSDRNQVS